MKYDLNKHAIIEDNGEHIATFNSCIPAGRAFKILDDLNNANDILDLEYQLDVSEKEYNSLKEDLKDCERDYFNLEKEKDKLDDRLQSIITMLESEYEFKTMQEMAEEIISICAAPL